ncbi:MAG: class I SAM-dependent methyltransferase [Armatimonadetes bacterium]|nr:class I SAM-dependent methyltransferase [Armatimonadota bacterium]
MRALEDRYWWFVSRRALARRLLDQAAPHCQDVLDLGCGTGALLSELGTTKTAFGLDFSEHAVGFCRQRGLPRLVKGDAERLPFGDGSFDAVVSLDTFEHLERDKVAMAEAFRVLRPGGTIVLNVPAFRWLWGPHDVALMHFRRYTRNEVRELLASTGFECQVVSYSVFLLFPVVVCIRALERLRRGRAEVRLPQVGAPLNGVLTSLMQAEGRWIGPTSLPWGSSVVAVGRKP